MFYGKVPWKKTPHEKSSRKIDPVIKLPKTSLVEKSPEKNSPEEKFLIPPPPKLPEIR